MADYDYLLLNNTYPPGRVDYPSIINQFIDINGQFANSIEEARQQKSSLLVNLNTYVKSTLSDNIDGSNYFKLSNMSNGTSSADYTTLSQFLAAIPTLPDIDDTNFTGPFNTSYHSHFKKVGDTVDIFDYTASSVQTTGNFLYLNKFNKTYFIDWSTKSETYLDLNNPTGSSAVAKNGDLIRIINTNTGSSDGIIAPSSKIQGHNHIITFGATYDHVIYDLVYTGSTTTGWLFKNVIIGNP